MRILLILVIAAQLSTNAVDANAVQNIHLKNGGAAVVNVSSDALTRFSIKGGRLKRIIGAEGKVQGNADADSGDAYLQPLPQFKTKSFSLFFADDKGNVFSLLLNPVKTPAEDIVIDIDQAGSGDDFVPGDLDRASAWENSHPYETSLVEVIRMMAKGNRPEGYGHAWLHQTINLWNEAEIVLVERYQGANFVGEKYRLTNTDKKVFRVSESEFSRLGVLAVAIEKQALKPTESTNLFVVSSATGFNWGSSDD